MAEARILPLYDAGARPPSWNERMAAGEFAVLFSQAADGVDARTCAVLPSLAEAEAYAAGVVAEHPELNCRIYDRHGMVGAPMREVDGARHVRRGEISSGFRRWVGSVLFFGGAILFVTDWVQDFRFAWPSVLGSRLLIPGLVLLVTEGLVMFYARRKAR